MQNQIAGDFERGVRHKQNSRSKGVVLRRQMQVLIHPQRSEADVDAIQKVRTKHEKHERNQAPPHLGHGSQAQRRFFFPDLLFGESLTHLKSFPRSECPSHLELGGESNCTTRRLGADTKSLPKPCQ